MQRKNQILKSRKQLASHNPISKRGNYILSRWTNNGANLALIPEASNELFDVARDKTNVLVFIDESDISNKNLRMFFALTLAKDPDFNVAITTNHDSGIAEHSDVIINLFTITDQGFNYGLETYNDGSRYFVTNNELSEIKSSTDFKAFIKKLKQNFILNEIGGMR